MATNKELLLKLKAEYEGASLKQMSKDLSDLKNNTDLSTKATDEYATKVNYLSSQVNKHRDAHKGVAESAKMSNFQLLEMGENLTVVGAGITKAIELVKKFAAEIIRLGLEGAQFQNLKDAFVEYSGNIKVATANLELMRKATAGTLDDAQLIKFANKMAELGYSTQETAGMMNIAETFADKFGTSIEDTNEKFMRFVETGKTKGLYQIGVNVDLLKDKVKELAYAQGLNADALTEEQEKYFRTQALLKTYGGTLSDINKKQKDNADIIESVGVNIKNAELYLGQLIGQMIAAQASEFDKFLGYMNQALAEMVPKIMQVVQVFETLRPYFDVIGLMITWPIKLQNAWGDMVTAITGENDKMQESTTTTQQFVVDSANELEKTIAEKEKKLEGKTILGVTEEEIPKLTQEIEDLKIKLQELKLNKSTVADVEHMKNGFKQMIIEGMKIPSVKDEILKLSAGIDVTKMSIMDIAGQFRNMSSESIANILGITKAIKGSGEAAKMFAQLMEKINQQDWAGALAVWKQMQETLKTESTSKTRSPRTSKEEVKKLTEVEKILKEINNLEIEQNSALNLEQLEKYKIKIADILALQQAGTDEWYNVKEALNDITNKIDEETKKLKGTAKEIAPAKKPLEPSAAKIPEKTQDGGEEEKKNVDEIVNQSLNFASQLGSILGMGADTFGAKLLNGLQQGLSLASSFAKLLSMVFNIGSGGFFGLLGLADGGYVSGAGTRTSDSILARLSNGEFVMNADSTEKYLPLLKAMNNKSNSYADVGRYASGGMVSNTSQPNITVIVQSELERTKAVKTIYGITSDVSRFGNKKVLG